MASTHKQTSRASQQEYTLEEEALIRQWVEYKTTVLGRVKGQPLPSSVCLVSKIYERIGNK